MVILDLQEQLNPYMVVDYPECHGVEVNQFTIDQAKIFLAKLPEDIPLPTDIGGDPDGMVNFEWYVNPNKLVSISVDDHGKLFWGALINNNPIHGSGYMNDTVIDCICHLINSMIEET